MEKPDLSGVAPDVAAYIEYLEKELGHSRTRSGMARSERGAEGEDPSLPPLDVTEPATPFQIITISQSGLIKRSARHLYERQRRGGMGIFDIDLPDDDAPLALCHADQGDILIVITNKARAFRLRVDEIPSTPVRSKGQSLVLRLQDDEHPAVVLPSSRGVTLVLVSKKGYARALPAHVVGMGMTPGVSLYRYAEFGPVAGACWSGGKGDVLIATRNGLGIRFPEKALALPGSLGIRLENGDAAVGVVAVQPPEGEAVLLVGSDGRGTLRLMEGFSPNKSPGGGGKIAFKSDKVIGAMAVTPESDIFIISRLGKMIRFKANEIPPKEGVVQGVHCMSLRGDECIAMVVT